MHALLYVTQPIVPLHISQQVTYYYAYLSWEGMQFWFGYLCILVQTDCSLRLIPDLSKYLIRQSILTTKRQSIVPR